MIKMRLKILLAESGITQQDLSKVTGIRQATISSYVSETYKYVAKEHIDILCNYFNCDIQDLIVHIKDKSKD